MGYSVYYSGEITVSPQLGSDHASLFDVAVRTNDVLRLGITPEDRNNLCHGCDWAYSDGALSIEGESRSQQETWLRLLVTRFFQPNGYTLAGEVTWDGSDSGDTGVIYVDENRIDPSPSQEFKEQPEEDAAKKHLFDHWPGSAGQKDAMRGRNTPQGLVEYPGIRPEASGRRQLRQ